MFLKPQRLFILSNMIHTGAGGRELAAGLPRAGHRQLRPAPVQPQCAAEPVPALGKAFHDSWPEGNGNATELILKLSLKLHELIYPRIFNSSCLSTTESRRSLLLLEQKATTQQWHPITFL